jgi:hypothetical protein
VRPKEQAWGEYDEQGKAAADCKELGRAHHLSVVVATQAATIVEEKQTKGRRAGKLDVYGSKEQVHVANTSIVITLKGSDTSQTDREEWERDVYWLCDIKKNRDGATFSFDMKHHVRYGYVEEIFDKATPVAAKDAIADTLKEREEEKDKKVKQQTTEPEKKAPDTTSAPSVTAEPSPTVVSVPETPAPKAESEPSPVADDPPPSLMVAPLSARKKKVG